MVTVWGKTTLQWVQIGLSVELTYTNQRPVRGAIATVATYLLLGKEYETRFKNNVWNDNTSSALSVVTFGSPASIVAEESWTTAALRGEWTRNFHHIINPMDAIPFVGGQEKQWAKRLLRFVTQSSSSTPLTMVCNLLEYWVDSQWDFAHFGRMYLLECNDHGINCRQITTLNQTPAPSKWDINNIKRFHSVEHYAHNLQRTMRPITALPGSVMSTSMSVDDFQQHCFPLPAAVQDCRGVIRDNHIKVSITVESRLMLYFLHKVTFDRGGEEVPIGGVQVTLRPDNQDQVRVFVEVSFSFGVLADTLIFRC